MINIRNEQELVQDLLPGDHHGNRRQGGVKQLALKYRTATACVAGRDTMMIHSITCRLTAKSGGTKHKNYQHYG